MATISRSSVRKSADRIRSGLGAPKDEANIREYRNSRAIILPTICEQLGPMLENDDVLYTARLKRYEAIIRKAIRLRSDVTRMDDIVGLRIIVGSKAQQDAYLRQLQNLPEYYRTQDYLTETRADGYRGVHIILRVGDPKSGVEYPIEIQLRSYAQHLWASISESFGQQVKEGGGTDQIRAFLSSLSETLMNLENNGLTKELDANRISKNLAYLIIQFNLTNSSVLDCMDLNGHILRALSFLMNFELRNQQTTEYETILLCARGKEAVSHTHIRYFPSELIREIDCWAKIRLPDWVLSRILSRR